MECTQERSVIRFLWPEGVKTNEIHGRMRVLFGYRARRRVTNGCKCPEEAGVVLTGKCVEVKEEIDPRIHDNQ
jgi:hypothetical protein